MVQNYKETSRVTNLSRYKPAGDRLIDSSPTWTVGEKACYVGTQPKCPNCHKARLIIVDRDILTDDTTNLRTLAKRNAWRSDEDVLTHFDKRTANAIKQLAKAGSSSL